MAALGELGVGDTALACYVPETAIRIALLKPVMKLYVRVSRRAGTKITEPTG